MRTVILDEGFENFCIVAVPCAFILLFMWVVTLKLLSKYSMEYAEFIISVNTNDKDAEDIEVVG